MGFGPNNRATPQEAAGDLRLRGWAEDDITTYLEGHGVTGEIAEIAAIPEVPAEADAPEAPAPEPLDDGLNPYVADRALELQQSGWTEEEIRDWAISDHNVELPSDFFAGTAAASAGIGAPPPVDDAGSKIPDVSGVPDVDSAPRSADEPDAIGNPYVAGKVPELLEHGWTVEQIQDWARDNHGVVLTEEQINPDTSADGEAGSSDAVPEEQNWNPADPASPTNAPAEVVATVTSSTVEGQDGSVVVGQVTSTMQEGLVTKPQWSGPADPNAYEDAAAYYQSLGYYVIIISRPAENSPGIVSVLYYTSNYNDVAINLPYSNLRVNPTTGTHPYSPNIVLGDAASGGANPVAPPGTPVPGAEEHPVGYGESISVSGSMELVGTSDPGQVSVATGVSIAGGVAPDTYYLRDPDTGNIYATTNWNDVKKQPAHYFDPNSGGLFVGTVYQQGGHDLPGDQRVDRDGNLLMPGDEGYDEASPTTGTVAFTTGFVDADPDGTSYPIFGNYEDWYISETEAASYESLESSGEQIEESLEAHFQGSFWAEAESNMYDPAAAAAGDDPFGNSYMQAGGIQVSDWIALGMPQTIGHNRIPDSFYNQLMAMSTEELSRIEVSGGFIPTLNMDRPLHGLDKLGDKWFGWDDMGQDIGNLGDNLSWIPIVGPILNMVTDPIEAYADAPAGYGSEAASDAFAAATGNAVVGIATYYMTSGIGGWLRGWLAPAAQTASQSASQTLWQASLRWLQSTSVSALVGGTSSFLSSYIMGLSQGMSQNEALKSASEQAAIGAFTSGLTSGTLSLLDLDDIGLLLSALAGELPDKWMSAGTASLVSGAYAYLGNRMAGLDSHDALKAGLRAFVSQAVASLGDYADASGYAEFLAFKSTLPASTTNAEAAVLLVRAMHQDDASPPSKEDFAAEVSAVLESIDASEELVLPDGVPGAGNKFGVPAISGVPSVLPVRSELVSSGLG